MDSYLETEQLRNTQHVDSLVSRAVLTSDYWQQFVLAYCQSTLVICASLGLGKATWIRDE